MPQCGTAIESHWLSSYQQRFELELVDGHTAAARARFSLVGWARLDLGIVKCNFEVAAGRENFEWQETGIGTEN